MVTQEITKKVKIKPKWKLVDLNLLSLLLPYYSSCMDT